MKSYEQFLADKDDDRPVADAALFAVEGSGL